MQDKNEHLVDAAFANQAWQGMSSLLDKEMPIERKRRWLPFLWLGAGIISIAVLYTFWSLETEVIQNNKPSNEKEAIQTTQEPIAIIEMENNPTVDITSTPELKASTRIAAKEIAPKNTNTNTNTNIPDSSIQNQKKSQYSNNSQVANTEAIIPATKIETSAEIVENQIQKASLPLENINAPIELNITPRLTDLELISAKELDLISIKNAVQLPEISIKSMKDKRSTFALRVGYGHNMINQENYHIGLDWQIDLAEKWAIITGLQYRFFPKNTLFPSYNFGTQIEMDQTSGSFPEMTSNNDTNESIEQAQESLNYLINEPRHAIVVPLNMQYQFKNKWSISSGFRAAYLLQKVNTSRKLEANSSAESTPASNTVHQSFELWTNVGVQYHPVDKWGVAVQYNRSWTPISNLPSNESVLDLKSNYFNHFVEASVLYRF